MIKESTTLKKNGAICSIFYSSDFLAALAFFVVVFFAFDVATSALGAATFLLSALLRDTP